MWNFGNHMSDGYTPKSYEYKPSWEKLVDYNPDHRPSTSGMFVEEDDKGVRWVLAVRDLGVFMMRAARDPETGTLEFTGGSNFTDSEIGWRS